MRKEYQTVIDFFGLDWFESSWQDYRELVEKEDSRTFSTKIILKEIMLHPLLTDVFAHQNKNEEKLDFSRIKPNSPADFHFAHLGRDLQLLQEEISKRGSHIKKDLLDSNAYESHRFNLIVAAGYKIEGYNIEFIPSSPEEKRADLFVSGAKGEFYIENKRANQNISDLPRYEFFSNLIEEVMSLLRFRKVNNLVIGIDAKGNIDKHKKTINEAINKKIWRNQKFQEIQDLNIKFSILDERAELFNFLKRQNHFRQKPMYTRSEDFLIASDPINKNIILLNKDVHQDEIPNRMKDLLEDANSKIKKDKKLIVYFDIGRGMKEWNGTISDYLYEKMSNSDGGEFSNIDTFVICQTALQHLGDLVQIRPNFNILGSIKKLGGKPEDFNLFGFQGHTGMDDYLLKDFLNPVSMLGKSGDKYIECDICGYKLIGLSTGLEEGALLSQVSMPCEQCGANMDMRIKILR